MADGFSINLDASDVQQVIQKAILDQINGNGRNKIITVILESLLSPGERDFETGDQEPSPLQKALNEACAVAARRVVSEEVGASPEFVSKVQEKVGEAMAMMDKEDYTSYIAEAVGDAMLRGRK
jgi:uncharacterized membrane-anchored protein YjiN (DUF445 family)